MKTLLTAVLLLVFHTVIADEFRVIKTVGIKGAIIPAETPKQWLESLRRDDGTSLGISAIIGVEADGFWTPTEKDIEAAESRLRQVLEKWQKNPLEIEPSAKANPDCIKVLSKQIGEILAEYSQYRRQYIGLMIGGRRHIYLNSFAAKIGHPSEFGPSYTKEFIDVMDDGSQYWRVIYSVEDASFQELSINGYA